MLESQPFSSSRPVDWTKTNTYSRVVLFYHDLIRLRRNLDGDVPGLKGDQCSVLQLDDLNKLSPTAARKAAPRTRLWSLSPISPAAHAAITRSPLPVRGELVSPFQQRFHQLRNRLRQCRPLDGDRHRHATQGRYHHRTLQRNGSFTVAVASASHAFPGGRRGHGILANRLRGLGPGLEFDALGRPGALGSGPRRTISDEWDGDFRQLHLPCVQYLLPAAITLAARQERSRPR